MLASRIKQDVCKKLANGCRTDFFPGKFGSMSVSKDEITYCEIRTDEKH